MRAARKHIGTPRRFARSEARAEVENLAPGEGLRLSFGAWADDAQELDWSNATAFPGITQLYRDLIHLRRNWFDNTRGLRGENVNVYHVNNPDSVIAFQRWDQGGNGDDVVIVLNFANRGYASYRFGFPRGGLWRVRFNSDWSGYDVAFGNWPSFDTNTDGGPQDSMPVSGSVGLGPYSAVILSQD